MDTFDQDAAAVAAVRSGDAERYRELVERHERRVYAVAWSRLGDAALAEEATQEAFIRAYSRLWLLGDGAKFAGWVNTIARRIAINLGLRHRRELNKRERWGLENPEVSTAENSAGETDPFYTPETLRQTLAVLPAAHRECLVLFYIEGKSGTEAAAALEISETALRVRLHRARAALRERLEERLAESLEQLRPSHSLSSMVMGTILTSSSTKVVGGGIGAKVMSGLMPVKFLGALFFIIPMLPALLLNLATTRMEQRNFRDAEGFRARMHRGRARGRFWIILPLLIVPLTPVYFLIAMHRLGIREFYLLLGTFLVVVLFFSARRAAFSPNRQSITTFVSALILAVGLLAIGFGLLPTGAFNIVLMLYLLVFVSGLGSHPARMDSNLFLRATQKMLEAAPVETIPAEAALQLTETQTRAFARFLTDRWLAVDHRWQAEGLSLQLAPLTSSWGFFGRRHSSLLLHWDGTVSAHLGGKDENYLLALQDRALPDRSHLEKQVAASVQLAWGYFRKGIIASAGRAVGQVPDADVFIVPPARSKAVLWQKGFILFWLALMLILMMLAYIHPSWITGLKPVNVTEAQVRAFLGNIHTNPNPIINNRQRSYPGDPAGALNFYWVLPPANFFSPDGLQAIRQEVFQCSGFDPHGAFESKISRLELDWRLEKAIMNGWISYADLGITPAQTAAHLRSFPRSSAWDFMRRRDLADGRDFNDARIDELPLAQLRWLREVHCLGMVDRKTIVDKIQSTQVLSGEASAGHPPLRNWRDVRGLFYTPNFPALQDTCCDLAALEILGGLDRIDREACIEAILRMHHGKGLFAPSDSGEEGRLQIRGDTRDTIAAFESLRILGALDQVKDLAQWKFRPRQNGTAKNEVTWDDVEAWVCQQRLEKILRERKEHPQAPVRSLLEQW